MCTFSLGLGVLFSLVLDVKLANLPVLFFYRNPLAGNPTINTAAKADPY